MIQGISRRYFSFAHSKTGNIAILFGLALVPIMLAVGVATDYGRAMTVRGRLADALDASALAMGSWQDLTQAELKLKAQQYFDANFPASELGTAGNINVVATEDTIIIDVSGSVPTTFMKLANFTKIDLAARTVITKKQRNIELALVLDTTGSMSSSGKMAAMQSAAKEMLDSLFAGKTTSSTLDVAVVPFAAAVNVGTNHQSASWIDKNSTSPVSYQDFKSGVKTFDLYSGMSQYWSWGGCVRERAGSLYELTDATPLGGTPASLFAPFLAPDEPDSDHDDGNYYYNSYLDDGNCGTSYSWRRTPKRCQKFAGKYNDPTTDNSTYGPNWNCPPRAITPLTNTKSTITTAIDALQPKGNTVIPAGLLWGWRVLSPTEPFTEGKPYNPDERVKAIVLLTDGKNQSSGPIGNHNGTVYNAFGFSGATNGQLGAASGSQANQTLNSKTQTACNNVKAEGILLYTIGFRVNDSTTQTLLKNCATKPDMYYNSPTNAQLAVVFSDIAQGLSELRIAQ